MGISLIRDWIIKESQIPFHKMTLTNRERITLQGKTGTPQP